MCNLSKDLLSNILSRGNSLFPAVITPAFVPAQGCRIQPELSSQSPVFLPPVSCALGMTILVTTALHSTSLFSFGTLQSITCSLEPALSGLTMLCTVVPTGALFK